MTLSPRDLRVDAPRLDAPDHFFEQLAALARDSKPSAAPRRGATLAAATVGVFALGVGGAWATGAIDVPGLPSQQPAPPAKTPGGPGSPEPSPSSVPDDSATSGSQDGDPQGRQPGEKDRVRPDRPGGSPSGDSGRGQGAENGQGSEHGQGAENSNSDDAGQGKAKGKTKDRPDSGKGQEKQAEKPAKPAKPEKTQKPKPTQAATPEQGRADDTSGDG